MPNEVATRDERTPVQQLIDGIRTPRFQSQIELALPEGMPASRFLRIAATALLENPTIVEASNDSIFASLLKAAGDGLLPDGREAALVVFKTKQGKKAQYLPMIGGYRKIAGEHGWALEATVVYEADDFTYELGLEPQLVHRPAPLGVERGKIVAAYAIGRELDTGAKVFEVMTAEDIDKVRKTSARSQEVWDAWPAPMSAKTVGRRLFKSLPLGNRDRVRKILAADELEPDKATELVYGREELPPQSRGGSREDDSAEERQTPAPTPEPSQEGEEAPPVAQAPPPPFHGEEPKAAEPEASKAAQVVVPEWSERYGGQTLGDIALAGDKVYLEWLASEAVTDETLRAAAAEVLEVLES